ncbi:uncharacterized protein LOC120648867 [Panicum virgatum]|uniref:uncharacterized protein LOC120648867 n=1 Tax=Panicum virgatum TaxID=38727 RepID=UPI0019D55774|nr:uncharacterized protein LOC120648867 [Panicum virgatum]
MAEIDTRPLDSVQAAVSIFDRGGEQSRLGPDRNEEEIAILTKELAICKLQLEVRESQHKQATLKIEALEKAVRELSDRYEKDCMDAHMRIAQLEAENIAIMSRQAEADAERGALRAELAAVRAQLDEARASVAFVLREVEAMETRAILERESTKDALVRILLLNETVLSSAVAAIRAEEERSVFFQEATLQLVNSDRNLEVVRRQTEMMERMEAEWLVKTVEVEYLRSQLQQIKEICLSPADVSDAPPTAIRAPGYNNLDDRDQVQACDPTAKDSEAQAEFTFQHSPEECFVSEIFRKDGHGTASDDGNKTGIEISDEDVVEDKQGAGATVQDTTVLEGNPDAQETRCHVAKTSGEDHSAIQPDDGKYTKAEDNHEPAESDGALPKTTACRGNDLLLLEDHEEAKAGASFVLESSMDDFQSVRSDAKDTSIAEPLNVAIAGSQEPRAGADAAARTSTPREGNPDTCIVDTEIASKDGDEFYTKELEPEPGQGQGGNRLDGYVLVSNCGDADVAAKDKQLDAARTEISDLRFSLEEAVRRAELAEEAKAALERELREELRRKQHTPSSTPSHTAGTTPTARAPRSARPGGEGMPTPARCLTLGKVLNMKY